MLSNLGKNKRNGPTRKLHPNSLANLAKPGEIRNPKGKNGSSRPRTWQEECEAWFAEEETISLPDGGSQRLSRRELGIRLACRRLLAGLELGAAYDPIVPHLLNRVWPVPRETQPIINIVAQQQTSNTVTPLAFVEEVRDHAGRQNITIQDVIEVLDGYVDRNGKPKPEPAQPAD